MTDADTLTTMHVRGAIAGNRESLDWVVTRLSPLLLAHASYRLGPLLRNSCDPHDLVSEAWLVALPRLAELPSRSGRYTPVLLRFLSTTIVNKVLSLARAHARRGADRASAMTAFDPLDELPAETSGVITAAVRRERWDRVREALDGLDDADREVILLRGIEQLSPAAIAVQLDSTAAAIARRYQRAVGKLRARLPGSIFDELDGT